jgi:hypothetical protein
VVKTLWQTTAFRLTTPLSTREPMENSPVPIEAGAMESLIPDDGVPGFDLPPV